MARSECLPGQRLQVLPCFWKLQLSGLHHRKVLCQWTWVSFGDFHVQCALCSEVCTELQQLCQYFIGNCEILSKLPKIFPPSSSYHRSHGFLIAVATRCHLHGNNLDYSIQARGAANSNSFDNISIFQYSIWQYSNGSYCVKTAKNNSIIIIIIIISALAWL